MAPFDEGTGFAAGALRIATRVHGLSLRSRACLALAAQQGATLLTTDKAWQDAGVDVEVVR